MDAIPAPSRNPIIRRSDYILLSAVGFLWLFAAGVAGPRAYAARDFVNLGLFSVGSVGFLTLTAGAFRRLYERCDFRGYFLHQFVLLALAVVPMRHYGPVWVIVLPAASQAVMVLPYRAMGLALLGHLALTATNFVDTPRDQLALTITNVLSSFTFTAGASYVIRRERDSREQLAVANEKLKAYAEKVQSLAVAEERNRLAQELHDGAAHHLTAANMLVAAGIAVLPEEASAQAIDALKKAQGQIREAIGEIRSAITERFDEAGPRQEGETGPLAASSEARLPLPQRIQRLIEQSDIPAELQVIGSSDGAALRTETEHALYRVAQEALTNASKHAPGARVTLKLDLSQTARAKLRAENAEPAVSSAGDGAVGLLSLRDRIQRLGGTFQAGPDRERRTFVVVADVAR